MRIPFPYLTFATLLLTAGASAQVAAAQVHSWQNEPSEFLGVPFFGDFKSQLPECMDTTARQPNLCWNQTPEPERYEIRGLPYIPISSGYQLFADLKDGSIGQLTLTGNASSLELVSDFLADTLGKSGSSLSRRVQLSTGASYEMKTITWQGKRIAVHFQRNESDLSRYTVVFTPTASDLKTLETSPSVDEKSGT